MAQSQDPRAARAEAAAWIARLHADDCSECDRKRFRDWLDADPAHADAFARATELYNLAEGAGRDYPRSLAEPKALPRRALALGGAAALGAVAVGAWFLTKDEANAEVVATGIGERRSVALRDGSVLTLDAQSQARMRFSRKSRSVELAFGRAHFRVAPDPGRVFEIASAGRRIWVEEGVLDVRCAGEALSVLMIEGACAVESRALDRQTLRAGERLTLGDTSVVRDRPDMDLATSWLRGRAAFDDEPLSGVAAEMNRYSAVRLVVNDPTAASMRVSGVYKVGDNVAFARSLAALLPLEARVSGGEVELRSAPSGQ